MAAVIDQRFFRPTLYGLGVAFAMFWSMHLLIAGGKYAAESGPTLATVDFVRIKKDSELKERERQKPVKPPPPKDPPPPPKMKVETPPPDAPPMPFAMPKLNLPTNISGGPFLGPQGDMSGYSDLIPMVRIQPQYPRQALRDGIAGFVVFDVVVNPDGTVKSARPIQAQPRGIFEAAAMQAIMKWKFRPKVEDGKAMESRGRQQIDFNMEEDEK
ncbi:MAG: energy transducer TonB [Nevskiaceae bacterium]